MFVGTITSPQSTASGDVVATVCSNPGVAVPLIELGVPIRPVDPTRSDAINAAPSLRPNAGPLRDVGIHRRLVREDFRGGLGAAVDELADGTEVFSRLGRHDPDDSSPQETDLSSR